MIMLVGNVTVSIIWRWCRLVIIRYWKEGRLGIFFVIVYVNEMITIFHPSFTFSTQLNTGVSVSDVWSFAVCWYSFKKTKQKTDSICWTLHGCAVRCMCVFETCLSCSSVLLAFSETHIWFNVIVCILLLSWFGPKITTVKCVWAVRFEILHLFLKKAQHKGRRLNENVTGGVWTQGQRSSGKFAGWGKEEGCDWSQRQDRQTSFNSPLTENHSNKYAPHPKELFYVNI